MRTLKQSGTVLFRELVANGFQSQSVSVGLGDGQLVVYVHEKLRRNRSIYLNKTLAHWNAVHKRDRHFRAVRKNIDPMGFVTT